MSARHSVPDRGVALGGGRAARRCHSGTGGGACPEALAAHDVTIGTFRVDRHELAIAPLRAFVAAKGDVTAAVKGLEPSQYPRAFSR